MFLFGARGAFFIWQLGLLLTYKRARGELVVYEPLRCFQCSGEDEPLCEGDDFHHGRSINCPYHNSGGEITREKLVNRSAGVIYNVPNKNPKYGKIMKEDEFECTEYSHKLCLRNYGGKFLRFMDNYRCWIMKVEYRANGRIEIYKGCDRDATEDFTRYTSLHGYPSVSDLTVNCKQMTKELGPSPSAQVTVCFCDTPYCNNNTILHTANNREVGLEDIEQRKRMKKSSADNIHQLAQTSINGPIILVLLVLTILFAPNIN